MPTTPTDAELLDLVKQALGGTLQRNASALRTDSGRQIASLSITDLIALRKDLELRVAAAAGAANTQPNAVVFRDPAHPYADRDPHWYRRWG